MFTQTILRRTVPSVARSPSAFASPISARGFARMHIIGRITAPEPVNTSTGKELVRYSIASNIGSGENQKTSWFRVASFSEGKGREFLLGLAPGTLLNLEAEARMGSYTDSEGKKIHALTLLQREIHVIHRPRKEAGASPAESEPPSEAASA